MSCRMLDTEAKSKPEIEVEEKVSVSPDAAAPAPGAAPEQRYFPMLPLLITLFTIAAAAGLGWAMWDAYMGAPWTRDGTVRAYVVTMAPEVAGRIVELPVADNQLVRKGDLLMVIDPTDYRIAVSQAEAAVQQGQASVQSIDAQMAVQEAQIGATQAQVNQAQAALVFAQQQAARYSTLAKESWGSVQNAQQYMSQLHQQEAAVESAQASLKLAQRQVESLKAQRAGAEATLAQADARLSQSRVSLERTRIASPVNGYVTNLLTQLGDFATAGQNKISLVNTDSFWVDGYFEETNLGSIHIGDPAEVKLMGYSQIVRGHVDSIARAINVANAQPNTQGVATVNPIFTWVRLAQRIPVRIHIDQVPPGVVLAAGMTATVQINSETH